MKINLTREEYNDRLIEAKYILDTLLKLEKYCNSNNKNNTIKSECDEVEIVIAANHNVSLRICTSRSESFKSTNCIGMLHFQDINSSNAINPRWLNFCPLNKSCQVAYFDEYKVRYPYSHSESEYFQNLTLHDLPEEFFYEESCKLLHEIKDLEIVSVNISMGELKDHHIKAIDKLLDQMGLN